MDTRAQNSKKIKDAVAKAYLNTESKIRQGMINLLKFGVWYCLQEHDDEHQAHITAGDSYGYCLVYNGHIAESKIYSGNSAGARANAEDALFGVLSYIPQTGWAGVVLAGMMPPTYFSVRAEYRFMEMGIADLKRLPFNAVFNKLVV